MRDRISLARILIAGVALVPAAVFVLELGTSRSTRSIT